MYTFLYDASINFTYYVTIIYQNKPDTATNSPVITAPK